MKRLITLIFAAVVMLGTCVAQNTYFPYPTPPESLPLGTARANYMVEHFWEHCPWKSAFSARKKLQGAFEDYAQIFPIAAADTVYASIDKLIDNVKKRPADLLELVRIAEATFYADTAKLPNDMVYLPFAKAAAENKKIAQAERDRLNRQVSVIEHSQRGVQMPDVPLLLADGSTVSLNDTTSGASEYVLIFDTPGTIQSRMERIHFAANVSAKTLIDANLLKPIYIYPGTPPESWWKDNEDVPSNWIVAAMPQAEDYIDMRMTPTIYVTDSSKRLTDKFMTMPLLIAACEQIMNQLLRGE